MVTNTFLWQLEMAHQMYTHLFITPFNMPPFVSLSRVWVHPFCQSCLMHSTDFFFHSKWKLSGLEVRLAGMRKQGRGCHISFLPGWQKNVCSAERETTVRPRNMKEQQNAGDMSSLPWAQHPFLCTALSAVTLFKTARANVNEFLFAYLYFFFVEMSLIIMY